MYKIVTVGVHRTQDCEAIQKYLKNQSKDYTMIHSHEGMPKYSITFKTMYSQRGLREDLSKHLMTYKHNIEGGIRDVTLNGEDVT